MYGVGTRDICQTTGKSKTDGRNSTRRVNIETGGLQRSASAPLREVWELGVNSA